MGLLVNRFRLFYVIPFFLHGDHQLGRKEAYQAVVDLMTSDPEMAKWMLPIRDTFRGSDVYAYLLDTLYDGPSQGKTIGQAPDSNIGAVWELNPNVRAKVIKNYLPTLCCHSDDLPDITLRVANLGIAIFRSHVGFFWFEVTDESCTIKENLPVSSSEKSGLMTDEISPAFPPVESSLTTDKNNHALHSEAFSSATKEITLASKLQQEAINLTTETLTEWQRMLKEPNQRLGPHYELFWPDGRKEVKVRLGKDVLVQLVDMFLGKLRTKPGHPCTELDLWYFARRRGRKNGRYNLDKALLFSYVVLRNEQSDTGETVASDDAIEQRILMETAYRVGQGITPRMPFIGLDNAKQDMFFPFEGCCWYATRENCGYFLKTSKFAKENMFKNFWINYFPLYLLLVHQSYAMQYYSEILAGYLSGCASHYIEPARETAQFLERFRVELNTLFMKGIYTSVAHLQNVNDFYVYMQRKLMIREDAQSLNMGLESLAELEEIQLEREREKQSRKVATGLAVLSILMVFSAFSDSAQFFDRFFEQNSFIHDLVYIFISCVLAYYIIVLDGRIPKWWKKRENDDIFYK